MSSIMENVGKKRARPRRSFTAQFKAEIVELCQRGDRTVRQVSQDFDLTETAVREWVKQAELDTGTRSTSGNCSSSQPRHCAKACACAQTRLMSFMPVMRPIR